MANHVKFQLNNCSVSGNRVEFDVFITNDGTTDMVLNSSQFGVNIDPLCLGSGFTMQSVTNGYVGNTEVSPPLPSWTAQANRSSITSLRFSTPPSLSITKDTGLKFPVGKTYKLGRFYIDSATGFVSGLMTNLKLQDVVSAGKTVCAVNAWVGASTILTGIQPPNVSTENICSI